MPPIKTPTQNAEKENIPLFHRRIVRGRRGGLEAPLKRLLRENQEYLDNYLDLYGSLEDDEYVARGNGFCDRKFSDDFIEGQIEKYRARVAELESWINLRVSTRK